MKIIHYFIVILKNLQYIDQGGYKIFICVL